MVSTLSGPIPPHPHYETPDNQFSVHNAGRTRPEGQEYAVKSRGTVGALLAIDGQGLVPSSAPARKQRPTSAVFPGDKEPESKDHVKQNVKRMRQIQRETKRLQEESSKPVKALWKSSKFEGVQSRVKEDLQKQQDHSQSRPSSASFLRAHSRTGMTPPPPQSRPSSADMKHRRSATPSAETARELSLKRNNFDFVKMNGIAARHSSMRRSPSLTALDDIKKRQDDAQITYKKGEVPKYLRQRQEQWAQEEEEKKAAIPDPEMPPGHRQMANDERLETLKKLQSSQHELQCKMASLPVRTDTVHIRRQKEELERQMSEVEEAVKIFSRRKVFVRLDT